MSEPRWNDAGTRAVRSRREQGAQPPSPPGGSPRWGQLPWGRGVVVVAVAAGLGALLTIVTGSDPGLLLGVVVVTGTVVASLAVDPRRAYLIIPAPALAYLAAAILAGLIHDRGTDSSHTLLVINVGRWAAGGFLGMIAATALATVITIVRWLRSSRGAGFGPTPTAARPPARDARRAQSHDRSPAHRDVRRRG